MTVITRKAPASSPIQLDIQDPLLGKHNTATYGRKSCYDSSNIFRMYS